MDLSVIMATVALAYLMGSIPFGLLVGFMRGVDVRKVGSCNIGATNVLRTVGKPWGILAFALDFGKGVAGALAAPCLARAIFGGGCGVSSETLRLVGGLAAVVGHTWPVWLGFRGGKGVATSFGMLLAVVPVQVGIAFAAWVVVLLVSRYVSLASICAATVLPVAVWLMKFDAAAGNWALPAAITVLGALVVLRHRANIVRLANGTENRFRFK